MSGRRAFPGQKSELILRRVNLELKINRYNDYLEITGRLELSLGLNLRLT